MITVETLEQQAKDSNATERHIIRMAIGFMKAKGITEAPAIGPFLAEGVTVPQKGQQVVIPKGVMVKTTNSNKGSFLSGRKSTITVDHVLGTGGFYLDSDVIIETPIELVWAGAGGYWHSVKLRDLIQGVKEQPAGNFRTQYG